MNVEKISLEFLAAPQHSELWVKRKNVGKKESYRWNYRYKHCSIRDFFNSTLPILDYRIVAKEYHSAWQWWRQGTLYHRGMRWKGDAPSFTDKKENYSDGPPKRKDILAPWVKNYKDQFGIKQQKLMWATKCPGPEWRPAPYETTAYKIEI